MIRKSIFLFIFLILINPLTFFCHVLALLLLFDRLLASTVLPLKGYFEIPRNVESVFVILSPISISFCYNSKINTLNYKQVILGFSNSLVCIFSNTYFFCQTWSSLEHPCLTAPVGNF